MAAIINETNINQIAGSFSGALAHLTGTFSLTDGTQIGTISPGNNTSNIPGSSGIRKILAYGFNETNFDPNLQAPNTFTTQSYQDILGAVNTNHENSDTATEPVGSTAIAADSTVTAGSWAVGTITSPDVPRNVMINIENDTGGNLNLYVGTMTFTVTGFDIVSNPLTETITFTSTSGNKAVGHAPDYRVKYGSKAFTTINSVTLDNVPDNGFKISVGIGEKIGFLNGALNAGPYFIRSSLNGSDKTSATTLDLGNQTFDLGTLADGDDVSITYSFANGQPVASYKIYDASVDADTIQVVVSSPREFEWWILGEDSGSANV